LWLPLLLVLLLLVARGAGVKPSQNVNLILFKKMAKSF
jgi:hypothetical protein